MIFVFDIDGTLADYSHREHLLSKVDKISLEEIRERMPVDLIAKDVPFPEAQVAFKYLMRFATSCYFVTGRREYLREVTTNWLKEHFEISKLRFDLFMRSDSEMNTASAFKKRVFSKLIFPSIGFVKNIHDEVMTEQILAFEDDKFVIDVYKKYCIVLKAPECWKSFVHLGAVGKEAIFSK
jgi:hydroxymethylpyrimidine pyrophosphatase-like HAD family hydrolase